MKTDKTAYRFALGVALVVALILVAVGVIGTPDELADLLGEIGVLALAIIGAIIAYKETKTYNTAYRSAVGVALGAVYILVWISLAVGIIGDPGDIANLMYLGVLAVGIIGVLIAGSQPRGMARALFATAFAQALVGVIAALMAGKYQAEVGSVSAIIALNAFFVMLFSVSAMLFHSAAKEQSPVNAEPGR